MNEELQSLIEKEKADILFEQKEKQEELPVPVKNESLNLVDKGIDAAIVHKIKNDENVQARMLNTADVLIDNKLE